MEYNLAEMKTLDIYLSGLSNEEYEIVKHEIGTRKSKPKLLLSMGIFMDSYHKRVMEAQKRIELAQVLAFAKKFKWKNDLELIFSKNDYQALIITDKVQKIIWVNDGFTLMTGYSKTYTKNKTPRFLQGEKTSLQAKNRIKAKIALDKPFKDVIINHRKDNSAYKCEVKIFPLYNEKTTHFIALEKQVI